MTPEELSIRRLIVCASGVVYWAGVLVQARRVRKQIRRSPNLKPRGAREKALWFGWFLVIVAWIGQPWLVEAANAGPGLRLWAPCIHPAGLVLGTLLVVLGYAATLWSYAAMGAAWRIGISTKDRTPLIRHGPYRWVRHPIYSLQIVMLAGALLLLPTWISLAVLLLHSVCVAIKSADEEKHLLGVHGDSYREFQATTGRLAPRILRPR